MRHTDYRYNIEYIDYDADSGICLKFCDGTFISYGVDLLSSKPTLEITMKNEDTRLVVLDDEHNHGFNTHNETGVCLIAEDKKVRYNSEAFKKCEPFDFEEESYVVIKSDESN